MTLRDFQTPTETKEQYPQYEIGRGTYGAPTIVDFGEGATLKIGAFCSIAAGVTIFLGGEHRTDWVTTYPFSMFRHSAQDIKDYSKTKGDVVIGNDVWIGLNATIMSGVSIGNGAVIGAHALVAKDVDPYAIVVGNPARCSRKRFPSDVIEKLEEIAWWSWNDKDIDKAMPLLLSNDIQAFIQYAQHASMHNSGPRTMQI